MNNLIVTGEFINSNYSDLYHFSESPLELFKKEYPQGIHFKPRGLWFSDESQYGWKKWCKDEDHFIRNIKYKFKIIFNDDAKILLLTTPESIELFTNNFTNGYFYINWIEVSKLCNVIFISPYIWEKRLFTANEEFWYYTWDCASGCIMNLDAIQFITKSEKIMTHYILLMLVLNNPIYKKKRYLSKKIGYSPQHIYRWINKGDKLILTLKALQKLCDIAQELGIEVDKNELF